MRRRPAGTVTEGGNDMRKRQRITTGRWSQRGYSLPELLVVIAIIGIFTVFSGPAMAEAYRSYKVRAAANELSIDIKALRYNAVTNRASRTITFNNSSASPPNRYSFINAKGNAVTIPLSDNVAIDTSSAASLTFNVNGSTGLTSNLTVLLSGRVSSSRGDRYTLTVTPSGTVSSAYSTYTP